MKSDGMFFSVFRANYSWEFLVLALSLTDADSSEDLASRGPFVF